MMRPVFLGLILWAAAACSGNNSGTTEPGSGGNPPGQGVANVPGTTNRTVTVQGLQREFVVHVGSSVGTSTSAPIVFMLHGTSGDGRQFLQISGWREKADQEGIIAVFPSALPHCFYEDENNDGDFADADERKVTTKWAHGELGVPATMPLCPAAVIASLPSQNRALVDHPLADESCSSMR